MRDALGAAGVRVAALPRAAWVLLLMAAVLVSMIAGALVMGSQPERKLPAVVPSLTPATTCPPGSSPDEPGRAGQARPVWPSAMAFDRRAGKLVAIVNPAAGPGAVETWTFDVCANDWTRMHPDHEPPAQLRSLVYDADSDLTIGVHSEDWVYPPVTGSAWAYDLEADTWTEKGLAPTDEPAFYDPVSGLVVAGGVADDLWDYDVETDRWTPIERGTPGADLGYSEYVYDASVDRIVEYAGGDGAAETRLLDLRTGAWSTSAAVTPVFWMGRWAVPAVVYDEAAKRTLVAGDDRWGVYDATADRWEILFDATEGFLTHPMVYDAVNRRLIVIGGGIGISGDIVAFDLATREWTVLLP